VVVLDPGLSFGTGHHPTTRFCLEQLVAHRPNREPRSFLDLGTGSGILAIAAAKLGYHPIIAIDHDPVAIRIAKANARKNRVSARLRFRTLNVSRLPATNPGACDLVEANLTSDVLLEHRAGIAACVREGGALVLSGVQRRDFRSIVEAYGQHGFELTTRASGGGWTSGCFLRTG
jgi:ribosomal protein L11 methyltransferase